MVAVLALGRVSGLLALCWLGAACGGASRRSPDHQVASGGAPEGQGGDPARAGSAALPVGGDESGGSTSLTGSTGGAGGAVPVEGGAGGTPAVVPEPPEPLAAVDCYPGLTMEEEGLSFDGRYAAVLQSGAPGELPGLALLDRETGLPLVIETVGTDPDPPSLSGDACCTARVSETRVVRTFGIGRATR